MSTVSPGSPVVPSFSDSSLHQGGFDARHEASVPFCAYPADALMRVAERPPRVFTRGDGSWLWDSTGRAHLDFVQGWAVNTLGHAPGAVADALSRQSRRLLQAGPGFFNDQAVTLARRLAALTGLDRVFIASSGAEANEGAIKLARKYGRQHRGGAFEIITFQDAFHGRTLATMSASGKPGFDTMFAPQVPGFPKARLNELDSVAALISPRTVAIMVEPVQGEAGVLEATPDFLKGLRRLCDDLGLLLILDEVQTGVGRTGRLWGHEWAGVKPDVMTLGKCLGGGVPIGALLATERASCFVPGEQGGTFNGNALVCAAALAVLDVVTTPGFLDGVQQRAQRLREGLDGLAAAMGGPRVRGQGMLLALPLPPGRPAAVVAEAAQNLQPTALLVNPVRPHALRLVPALNVTDADIDLAVDLLGQALR